MENLLKQVFEIFKKHNKLAEQSGNNYNVFNVINVTTSEVRLHSKFISELLNPKGSHGQGDIFLKLFTEKFKIDMNTKSAKVEIEKHIGKKTDLEGGILDIYVFDNKGKTITIENKIYAPDQENQILRYYNFNKNNVFYLTLFGDEPSKSSYGNLETEKDFKLLSYRTDIIEWLIECRKEAVEFPLLREGISHYINLIKTLTGQSNNHIMNTEIRDYIASSSEKLKQASLIEQNMSDAKVKIQWLFWQNLKDKMIEKGLSVIEIDSVNWQNVNRYYNISRNRDINYGLWVKVYEKDDVSIHFGIEIENQIYFGFTVERNGKGGIAKNDENANYRNMVLDINDNYIPSQAWLGYRNLDKELNFRAFNSDAVFELADRNKMNKQVDNIVDDIVSDIKTLKIKLNIE